MISFTLSCSLGHSFEGWFASSEAFDRQRAEQGIACPVCGDVDVAKALMAPAVATSRREEAVRVVANVSEEPEMMTMLRKMRQHLTANADYVGDRFAEEARRIHYEEVGRRGIYGEATKEDVRSLADEGIEFHPLPVLPEDHN
ncbi:MAG: DUF1178 family protein [Rhizobiales bacterium]|nr:DUF1178 family protein [Hyphomicrobiales bacterium]